MKTSSWSIMNMRPESYSTLMVSKENNFPTQSLSQPDLHMKKAYTSKRKMRKTIYWPGKNHLSTPQIFKTSDRISYGFNKIEPFAVKSKKSISQLIADAQQNEPERKLIKANNYYLHNFLMGGKNLKSTMVCFRLNEILSEKKNLIK